MIADSHCHLTLFEDGELQSIVSDCLDNGVCLLHSISTTLDEREKLIEICEKYKNVYCSVGIHPNNVRDSDIRCLRVVENLAMHKKVISIGETGLDYYHQVTDRKLQQVVFRNHIRAAMLLKLPVVVHSRDAEDDTISIISEEVKNNEIPIILHSFASKRILFDAALKYGWYISFSGIVTFNNAKDIQKIAFDTPEDRLLIETDAPYLAPAPKRGKKNYPHFIVHTMDFLKKLRGDDNLDASIMDNFIRVFGVAPKLDKA